MQLQRISVGTTYSYTVNKTDFDFSLKSLLPLSLANFLFSSEIGREGFI
jgi:hypothetical protein